MNALYSVAKYGDLWAVIWGGQASMFLTMKGKEMTWKTQEEAQRVADLMNQIKEIEEKN